MEDSGSLFSPPSLSLASMPKTFAPRKSFMEGCIFLELIL
jgi:hypothetical protein